MSKMIVTTTNSLEGYTITEYFQPITANVVIGSNLFSDISASFTDLFGGRSGTYERKLQQIYQQAIANLKKTASSMGATCILGLKVDIDEISGKGSQMFMITAYGTPVRATAAQSVKTANIETNKTIEGSAVTTKIKINNLLEKLKNNENVFYEENIRFVLETQSTDAKDYILKGLHHYATHPRSVANEDEINARAESLSNYFGTIPPEDAKEILYTELYKGGDPKYTNTIMLTVAKFKFLDFPRLLHMVSSRNPDLIKLAVQLLSVEKDYYTQEDIGEMSKIKGLLTEVAQPAGKVSKVKKLLGGEKEVWICQCGHTNNIELQYCEKCGNDIYGYKPNEMKPVRIIKLMEDRVTVLKELSVSNS